MAKAPAFQFYVKDWLADGKVRRLSWEAKGVYIELLALMWNEGHDSLPDNDEDIAQMLGMQLLRWREIRVQLQRENSRVFLERGGQLVSKRLKEERRKQRHISRVRRNAALSKSTPFVSTKRRSASASAIASAKTPPTPSRESVDGFEIGGAGAPPKVQTTPAQVMAFQGVYRQAIYPENPAHAPPLKDSWLDAVTNKWTPEFTASITPEMLKAAKGKTDDRYWSPNTFLTWFEGPGKNWKGGKRPIPPQKPPDPEIARMEAFLGLPVPEQERHIAEAKKQYPDMPRNVLRAEAARTLAKEQT